MVEIVDAPKIPWVSVNPPGEWLLLMERAGLPPIAELAERELGLAGIRIKPRNDGPSRAYYAKGLEFLKIGEPTRRRVEGLPEDARISRVRWSPDGSRIAFTVTVEDGIELWTAGVENGVASRLTPGIISLAADEAPRWFPDSRTLLCCLVSFDRGTEPAAPLVPAGPVIRENLGKVAPARTYRNLLSDPHDEALFDYYFTTRLASVTLDGTITSIGPARIVWFFDPSPNGEYILVESLHRPYSYLVTASRFPRRVEIWDREGRLIRIIADLPLQEEIPIARSSVAEGPRSVGWREDAAASLFWVEALDGGDSRVEAAKRDRLLLLPAPFHDEPVILTETELRYGGIRWGSDSLALVSEWWWETRKYRTWILQPGKPEIEPAILFDRSWEDRYSDPGDPITRTDDRGRSLILTARGGSTIFLTGDGASPEGDRPFLDAMDLKTGESRRLFRSEAPFFERPVRILDEQGHILLTRRESIEEPPNYFVRDAESDTLHRITNFPHPAPQVAGISKEIIRYKRDDGVSLTATLYLPAGYNRNDGPLPLLMWAYPREFKDASAAGQVTDSPYRFNYIYWWSPIVWPGRGYAVLDDPAMPIVGEGDSKPNDTYVRQLVSSASAAVDEVVRRGVAERGRIAIGGHSYGAFMAANLLAHSDLFAAGIARTGAYNRTLTPFGFQSEDRTLWEAPHTYFEMSPFMQADKVNEPLLLIHGAADDNSATFPMQSERFYNALKGLGATARLVMLPHESHSYRARESILHVLYESNRWLEKYLKNTGDLIPAAPDGKNSGD